MGRKSNAQKEAEALEAAEAEAPTMDEATEVGPGEDTAPKNHELKDQAKETVAELSKAPGRNESKGEEGQYVWKTDVKMDGKRYLCGDVCEFQGQNLAKCKEQGLVVKHENFAPKKKVQHVGR